MHTQLLIDSTRKNKTHKKFHLSVSTTAASRERERCREPWGHYCDFPRTRRHETTAETTYLFILYIIGYFSRSRLKDAASEE